ncbi:hypothetical protein VPH35_125491 [Triticum aestivum]
MFCRSATNVRSSRTPTNPLTTTSQLRRKTSQNSSLFPSPPPPPPAAPVLCYPRREEPTSRSNQNGKAAEEWRDGVCGGGKGDGAGVLHRLKHGEERREASWKAPEGRVFSATTRTDVVARLGELRDQILVGCASFTDLAAQHSGCSSARCGGDLVRMVEPIDMQNMA